MLIFVIHFHQSAFLVRTIGVAEFQTAFQAGYGLAILKVAGGCEIGRFAFGTVEVLEIVFAMRANYL